MQIVVAKDYDELSLRAANIIKDSIEKRPDIVLGLPTGSTPIGMYRELIRMHREEGLDFSRVITFNLDEYVGIDESHPSSYHYFMKDVFFQHINIDSKNIFILDGRAKDLEAHCNDYEKLIRDKGGIDIQILGIGENGHIGFNEPDRCLNMNTSMVNLRKSTIEVNSRFFKSIGEVPRRAITMGIGSIMRAKKIILLANGERKANAMSQLLRGNSVTTDLPASMLLLHPDLTILLDEKASKI